MGEAALAGIGLGISGMAGKGPLKGLLGPPEAPNVDKKGIEADKAAAEAADAERRRRRQTQTAVAPKVSEALASNTARTTLGGVV